MATKTGLFLIALVCVARGNPLGQTTVCESTPNMLPGLGLNMATGMGGLGLGMPGVMGGVGTVCETVPNVPNILGYGGLGYPGFPNIGGVGATTVCESVPNNLGLGINGLGYGIGFPGCPTLGGATTICESVPNMGPIPYGLGLGGLAYGSGLGYGVPYGLGSTTLCESGLNVPLGGFPVGGISGLGGAIGGVGFPCGGMRLPYPGLLGETTVCESIPNRGIGYGMPLGMGYGLGGVGSPFF